MSFPCVVSPSKTMNIPETNSLFADVAAAGLGQALPQHKEPIVSSGFCPGPPWCHGHEAARWWAESDGYLYRNISFSPPASVHIKSLAHHTSIPCPWPSPTSPRTSKPTCGGTFLLQVRRIVRRLRSQSDSGESDSKLCHLLDISQHMK